MWMMDALCDTAETLGNQLTTLVGLDEDDTATASSTQRTIGGSSSASSPRRETPARAMMASGGSPRPQTANEDVDSDDELDRAMDWIDDVLSSLTGAIASVVVPNHSTCGSDDDDDDRAATTSTAVDLDGQVEALSEAHRQLSSVLVDAMRRPPEWHHAHIDYLLSLHQAMARVENSLDELAKAVDADHHQRTLQWHLTLCRVSRTQLQHHIEAHQTSEAHWQVEAILAETAQRSLVEADITGETLSWEPRMRAWIEDTEAFARGQLCSAMGSERTLLSLSALAQPLDEGALQQNRRDTTNGCEEDTTQWVFVNEEEEQ
eukprot:PhM_4_TR5306/c0_g1_i1/m.25110